MMKVPLFNKRRAPNKHHVQINAWSIGRVLNKGPRRLIEEIW